jgi:hypothetical protein
MRSSGADVVIQAIDPPMLVQADGCVGLLLEPQTAKPIAATIDNVSPEAVLRWVRAIDEQHLDTNPAGDTWHYEPRCVSAFRTRENSIGVLEITRVEPRSMRIRYKLVQQPGTQPFNELPEDASQTVAGLPPVVVRTEPPSGARDVAPGVTDIHVTFSKEMADRSWSWSTA